MTIAPALMASVTSRPAASSLMVVRAGSRRQPATAPSRTSAPEPGDGTLPGEIVLPPVRQPAAQRAFGIGRVRAADEVRQLAVDADLGQGQPRPERPREVNRGGQALPEQVDLARARQAPAGCRCAHGDDLAGHVDGLHRRRLDRYRDRDHRDHQEGHDLRGVPEQPLPPARRFRLGHGVLRKGTWYGEREPGRRVRGEHGARRAC